MSSPGTPFLLGVLAFVIAAVPAEAQLGGLLKKKAKEAIQAPVKQEQAKQQSEDAAARALSSPDIVPITEESTGRFRKALNVEARLRGEFRAFLASLKTQEAFDACKLDVAISPEGEKARMPVLNLGDDPSPADLQKAMLKASADLEAIVGKRCGSDPGQWRDGKRADRLREIEAEASDALAASDLAHSASEPSAGPITGPSAGAAEQAAAGAHPYLRKYGMLKERWIPFCGAQAQSASESGGAHTQVKGVGSGVYVYSAAEAAVMTANCAAVMADLNRALDPVSSPR